MGKKCSQYVQRFPTWRFRNPHVDSAIMVSENAFATSHILQFSATSHFLETYDYGHWVDGSRIWWGRTPSSPCAMSGIFPNGRDPVQRSTIGGTSSRLFLFSRSEARISQATIGNSRHSRANGETKMMEHDQNRQSNDSYHDNNMIFGLGNNFSDREWMQSMYDNGCSF